MDYFSTISRISMGQLLTQMPQAIHLPAVAPETAGETMTWKGQTSAHFPQPVQSFLLIMYTPVLGFWVMAPASHALRTCHTGCGQRLRGSVLFHNLDTGLILMEFLVEGL